MDSNQTQRNTIDFVTIASTGDAVDFGDLQSPTFNISRWHQTVTVVSHKYGRGIKYDVIEIPQGAIRFNTDSQKLEFYAQGEWWIMSTDTPNLGRVLIQLLVFVEPLWVDTTNQTHHQLLILLIM